MRPIASIDFWIDHIIAQVGQFGRRRDITIRIDARRLHPPVPNVAIDVVRKIRRRKALLVTRNYGKGMTNVMQRIVNRGIARR